MFLKDQEVQLYYSSDLTPAWKNSYFILSEWSDFYIAVQLSIAVHAYVYVDITFSRWDITNKIDELVY